MGRSKGVLAFVSLLVFAVNTGRASSDYLPPYDQAHTYQRCSSFDRELLYSCKTDAQADKTTGRISGSIEVQPQVSDLVPGLSLTDSQAQIQIRHTISSGHRVETATIVFHVHSASVDGPEDGNVAAVELSYGIEYEDLDICHCYHYVGEPIVQTNDVREIVNKDLVVQVSLSDRGQPLPAGTLVITASLHARYFQSLPPGPTQIIRSHAASARYDAIVTSVKVTDG